MSLVAGIIGGILVAAVLLARCFCLAPCRAGWGMYLANVAWELLPKKLGVGRFRAEAAAAAAGLVLLRLGGAAWGALAGVASVLIIVEACNRRQERRILAGGASSGPILTLEGPLVARWPRYSLGVRWAGRPFDLELVIGNPGSVPVVATARLDAPADWWIGEKPAPAAVSVPAGGVGRARWTLRPRARQGGGVLEVAVESGGQMRRIRIEHDGCRFAGETAIARAAIRRYPGGRRSAFAWRGDMDLYDSLTGQSIEGLEKALGLAARYAFPQTMCLSTRLSFDVAAAKAWAAHEGRDHGAEEIPRFIDWLRENADLRHACPYPMESAKPYVLEIGNHGHLHYDTAAAAAPENGWTSHARMGAGRYPWVGEDTSSFGEQRDNILEAARWCERRLGYVPRSWAKPGRCNDADTARAAAAAGCEVLSGSDIRARDNVLFQPPPHHPRGTDAVELTSRYPPDPQHLHHFAMLRFWLHRSRRRARPMVFMCHQHLRQWEGPACMRFTEALLRSVLADFHGDFRVDTLFGVGKYWKEVLSPRTRRVSVRRDGTALTVENGGDMDFEDLPVDLELADGARSTVLVSVRASGSARIDLADGKAD